MFDRGHFADSRPVAFLLKRLTVVLSRLNRERPQLNYITAHISQLMKIYKSQRHDMDDAVAPGRKKRKLNYSKCTFCRKDKKSVS